MCAWIARTVPRVIEPETWSISGGGYGEVSYYSPKKILVVYNTPGVHAKLEAFLKMLGKLSTQATQPLHGLIRASYPVPEQQKSSKAQPRHKFTIQYEGEGVIDSNVVALFKALSGENANAGSVMEIFKALQGQGATANPETPQAGAAPALTGEGVPGGKKEAGPTPVNMPFPFLQSLNGGKMSGTTPVPSPFLPPPPPPPHATTIQTPLANDTAWAQLKLNGVTSIQVDILPSSLKLSCHVLNKENPVVTRGPVDEHLYYRGVRIDVAGIKQGLAIMALDLPLSACADTLLVPSIAFHQMTDPPGTQQKSVLHVATEEMAKSVTTDVMMPMAAEMMKASAELQKQQAAPAATQGDRQ